MAIPLLCGSRKMHSRRHAALDPDAYISDWRCFVQFETQRAERSGHLGGLKNQLVELINRDCTDFVNLSTKIVDVDGGVLRMRMPLNELWAKLAAVKENVNSTLVLVQDGLRRRADAPASREILKLLLDTSNVVAKDCRCLKLIKTTDLGWFTAIVTWEKTPEETRSQLLERIAKE